MLQTPQVTNKNRILDLVAWMRTHDPNERYDWSRCNSCLIGQYTAHLGLPCIVSDYADRAGGYNNYLWIARGTSAEKTPPCDELYEGWTFGQAIARAEELLAS